MNELVREIEEDMRRERAAQLWHSFGKIMVAVSVGVLLITIVTVIVQNHRQARATEETTQFIKGMDRLNIEDYKGAITVFDQLGADPSSTYHPLAMLHKAQAQKASGDTKGAKETYDLLASHDPVFGEIATMLANDRTPPPPSRKDPFYYSLSEWRGWKLMQEGKKDEAVTQFAAIHDDLEAPPSIRDRMEEVLQHIAPEKLKTQAAAHE